MNSPRHYLEWGKRGTTDDKIAYRKQKKLYTVGKEVDGITSSIILEIKTLLFPGKFRNDCEQTQSDVQKKNKQITDVCEL